MEGLGQGLHAGLLKQDSTVSTEEGLKGKSG